MGSVRHSPGNHLGILIKLEADSLTRNITLQSKLRYHTGRLAHLTAMLAKHNLSDGVSYMPNFKYNYLFLIFENNTLTTQITTQIHINIGKTGQILVTEAILVSDVFFFIKL